MSTISSKKIYRFSDENTDKELNNIYDNIRTIYEKIGVKSLPGLAKPGPTSNSSSSGSVNTNPSGVAGEVNTASNLGSGKGVYSKKVGKDLQFRSLTEGEGIGLTLSATEIEIKVTIVDGGTF